MKSSFFSIPVKERSSSTTTDRSLRKKENRSFHSYLDEEISTSEKKKKQKNTDSIFDLVAPPRLVPLAEAYGESLDSIHSCSSIVDSSHTSDVLIAETANALSHIVKNQDKETTLRLSGDWCIEKGLSNVELTIYEFSTAPLAYTIIFRGTSSQIQALEPHLASLRSFFHKDKKEYTIHSIDVELDLSSDFYFHRKDPVDRGHGK